MLDAGEIGRCEDVNDVDKEQIVMAKRLSWSISKKASLVGCSRSVLVST